MASTAAARPLWGVLLVLAGCSASPEPAVPRQAAGPAASAGPREPGLGGRLARVELRSQGVTLVLPDSSAWRAETSGTWTVLLHKATDSRLYVKQWTAARLVRTEECLAQARLGQPAMIDLRDEEIVERRKVTAPPEFSGDVVVAVREVGPELHGYAELASAGVGRCFVAVFHTVTQGRGREEEVGQRLATIVENVFEKARTRVVEDRVAR